MVQIHYCSDVRISGITGTVTGNVRAFVIKFDKVIHFGIACASPIGEA